MTTGILFTYKLAPKSRTSFTILDVDRNSSEDLDVSKLTVKGLQKVLFVFKNKIDPKDLRLAASLWRGLPESKQSEYDADLDKRVPAERLRVLLLAFLARWYDDTLAQRELGIISTDKFDPQRVPLHSVTATTSVLDQSVAFGAAGLQIQPAACQKSLEEIQSRIKELAAQVSACSLLTADYPRQQTCYAALGTLANASV